MTNSSTRMHRVASLRRCVVIALILAATHVVAVTPATADVSFINSQRSSHGLAPVGDHSGLASVAARQAQRMASQNRMFHNPNLASEISAVLPNWSRIAENVGVGSSVSEVNSAFMRSSTHRANILGAFNLAGTGAAQGSDGRIYVAQVFAYASSGSTAQPAPAPSDAEVVSDRVATTTSRVSRSTRRLALPSPKPVVVPERGGITAAMAAAAPLGQFRDGYLLVGADGGVFSFGAARFSGSASGTKLNAPVVAAMTSPTGEGYWLAAEDGGVVSLGDSPFWGSAAAMPLAAPVVGAAPTATGHGYRLATADGGVLTFGDALFEGSAAETPLAAPVVGIAVTPSGRGYWLAAADGGVFAFGDAAFLGSAGELRLSSPVVSIAATPTGRGYWLAAADGGVFAYGDAVFAGSAAGTPLASPIAGIIPSWSGHGYRLIAEDGGVFSYGDAPFHGSVAGRALNIWRGTPR